MEQTKEINKTLRMVRTHLPAPGTELGIYTFWHQMPSGLAPWTHSVPLWWWQSNTWAAKRDVPSDCPVRRSGLCRRVGWQHG